MATPPTIGPTPAWVSGQLRFYKPTAGTNALAGGTFSALRANQAEGPYTTDVSAAYSDLTWRATDGTGEYVTTDDLGLTVSATAWYRDRIGDSGDLSAEGQTAVYGGDTSASTCVVSFDGLTAFAGRTISARLSDAVTVNGTTFPAGPYSTTIAADGTASVTLPRLDAGQGSVSDGTPFAYFIGASTDSTVIPRRVPDQATATFATLLPPGDSGYDFTAGVIRAGEGVPADDLGQVGDFYLDTLTGIVYQLRD